MNKYKLEDLKIGSVFKNGSNIRTIVTAGKTHVFYSFIEDGIYKEYAATIKLFLDGWYGDLVKPTTKVTYVEYQSKSDLITKHYCSKEVWYREINASTNHKFIREFEVEVGEDGFPIKGGVWISIN